VNLDFVIEEEKKKMKQTSCALACGLIDVALFRAVFGAESWRSQ
jgi:hypothetical protein